MATSAPLASASRNRSIAWCKKAMVAWMLPLRILFSAPLFPLGLPIA